MVSERTGSASAADSADSADYVGSAGSAGLTGVAGRAITIAALAIIVANVALTLPSSLPGALQVSLHATGGQITWYSTLFGVATALGGLPFAVLGDLRGRKRVLLLGFALVAIGSLIALLAGDIHVLWVAQAVAGFGGGALYTCSLATIVAASRTPRARATAIAIWTVALALGTAIGPFEAGLLAKNGDWRLAYIPVLVLAVVVGLACVWFAPESVSTTRRAYDWGGQALIALCVLGICYGSIQGSEQGWTYWGVLLSFALAVVFLAAFLWHEARHPEPLLRLSLFRSPAFSSAAFIALVGMASFVAGAYMLGLLFGIADGLNPFQVALRLVPLSLVTVVLYPVLRRWLASVSARWLLGLGVLPLAAGLFWLGALPEGAGYGEVIVPTLLCGVGFAFLVSSLTTGAVNSVPIQLGSVAAGTTETLRLIGQTLAIAVIGAIGLSRANAYVLSGLARLGSSGIPAPVLHAAEGIASQGGVVAVASVPLGPASKVITPLALTSLTNGLDDAFRLAGIVVLVGAVVALVFLRDDPGRILLEDPEDARPAHATAAATIESYGASGDLGG
jgi:MFS family permease